MTQRRFDALPEWFTQDPAWFTQDPASQAVDMPALVYGVDPSTPGVNVYVDGECFFDLLSAAKKHGYAFVRDEFEDVAGEEAFVAKVRCVCEHGTFGNRYAVRYFARSDAEYNAWLRWTPQVKRTKGERVSAPTVVSSPVTVSDLAGILSRPVAAERPKAPISEAFLPAHSWVPLPEASYGDHRLGSWGR